MSKKLILSANQDTKVVLNPTACPDMLQRLEKIYTLAIMRYNQSKPNETAGDESVDTISATLTQRQTFQRKG